jgi:hypothetical protein
MEPSSGPTDNKSIAVTALESFVVRDGNEVTAKAEGVQFESLHPFGSGQMLPEVTVGHRVFSALVEGYRSSSKLQNLLE